MIRSCLTGDGDLDLAAFLTEDVYSLPSSLRGLSSVLPISLAIVFIQRFLDSFESVANMSRLEASKF